MTQSVALLVAPTPYRCTKYLRGTGHRTPLTSRKGEGREMIDPEIKEYCVNLLYEMYESPQTANDDELHIEMQLRGYDISLIDVEDIITQESEENEE